MSVVLARRVRVILEANSPDERALGTVLRVAARQSVAVEGVFVEDARSFQIASAPYGRFVTMPGAPSARPDEAAMRRAYRVASARMRERFAAELARARTAGTFRSLACETLADAFADATGGDLVIALLARGGRNMERVSALIEAVRGPVTASLLVLNLAGLPEAAVIAVFDGAEDDLAAAASLAESFGCPLRILAVEGADPTVPARIAPGAPVRWFAAGDAAALETAIQAAGQGTLAVDRTGEAARRLDLAAILRRTPLSVYLRN